MGEVSLGIKSEKPPMEDIEAANILLLLWERTIARNKRMQTHPPFITNNAPQAAAHALFLQNHHHQQHTVHFQRPHYYFSAVPPQACFLRQPFFTYYGLMANTPSCCVGPLRVDAESTPLLPPPPPVAFKDNHTSASSELDVNDRKRPSGEQTLEPGAKRRPRNSSGNPEAKRRRKNLTKEQVRVLEEAYSMSKYPQIEDRVRLQGPTKLSEARIQVWFQNRRAKERREVESKIGTTTTTTTTTTTQQQGAQGKDPSITTPSLKDNSQESTENEEETAGDEAEEHSEQSNVLNSYTEETLPRNDETFA